jgi:sugar-specific transcriptional regulator TrmB
METKQVLKDLGLNENEVKVYLELLKLGSSKVNEISKRLNLPRTTVYTVLNSLIQKGFASYAIKSGIKCFEAAQPKKILSLINEKKESLTQILPNLESIKASILDKPSIEIYEGREGLKTLMDDIIESKPDELLTITSVKIFKILEFYFPHWVKRRAKAGIKTRIVGPRTKESESYLKKYKKTQKKELREIRSLAENIKIDNRIEIYGNKMIITNLEKDNLVSLLIKDKKISNSFKAIFNLLWNQAKK